MYFHYSLRGPAQQMFVPLFKARAQHSLPNTVAARFYAQQSQPTPEPLKGRVSDGERKFSNGLVYAILGLWMYEGIKYMSNLGPEDNENAIGSLDPYEIQPSKTKNSKHGS